MKACVDIGGTKVAVSLSDGQGLSMLSRQSEPTVKTGDNEALARQVVRLTVAACREAGTDEDSISAMGVSSCGPFVMNGGLIELAAPNICGGLAGPERGLPNTWKSAVLEAPLRQRYANVKVANDCVAALEAERRWGALQGLDHCAYITWSTGIGMGVCVDGHVLSGKNGNAGHGGHMFVSDDLSGALCGCGNHGDVEALVAGNAMARRFGKDAAALMDACSRGDREAIAIVDELCRVLGRAIYNLVITLDLEKVSLGGSVFWHHRDYLLPRLKAQLAGHLPALTDGVELVPAGLGMKVGDYAALALVQ
ncbi:MAG: ROK family protein [Comamonadaceae bacterium]|nr:MAG: ROK family protein [Comamonadaceae bacterium]